MDYAGYKHVGSSGDVPNCFMIPYGLLDFDSQGTKIETDSSGKQLLIVHGNLWAASRPYCRECQTEMHINNTFSTTLRHLPFGGSLSFVRFTRRQYRCPHCGKAAMRPVTFRAAHHRATKALEKYAEDLLGEGYTNKEVSSTTGLGHGTVKEIDKCRLRREYTESGEEGGSVVLRQSKEYAAQLSID